MDECARRSRQPWDVTRVPWRASVADAGTRTRVSWRRILAARWSIGGFSASTESGPGTTGGRPGECFVLHSFHSRFWLISMAARHFYGTSRFRSCRFPVALGPRRPDIDIISSSGAICIVDSNSSHPSAVFKPLPLATPRTQSPG